MNRRKRAHYAVKTRKSATAVTPYGGDCTCSPPAKNASTAHAVDDKIRGSDKLAGRGKHPQSRKCNAVRGCQKSTEPRGHVQKIEGSLDMWFFRYFSLQTDTLISTSQSSRRRSNNRGQGCNFLDTSTYRTKYAVI